jgi:DNA polymerase III delta' subunit
MEGVRTRGHPAALDAVTAMIRGRAPHAVLLVGPSGVGKTTLALDLAAGLLCTAADESERPCGSCRACRLVASGGHPDVHRLGPDGPGRQVVIGGPGSRTRGIRDLIAELALMPVEGGARIAIIEAAQRINEDAQAALLKTLEEPPSGVTLVLCADAEETLLPTIRSRCARVRLGPVGPRAVEAILDEHGIQDPGLAARLARICGGRPGHALAWAADPDALRQRDELTRVLLDLTAARPSERLAAVRASTAAAVAIAGLVERASTDTGSTSGSTGSTSRGRRRVANGGQPSPSPAGGQDRSEDATDDGAAPAAAPDELDSGSEAATTRTPAAERRRAAEVVVAIWADLARDLLLARLGLAASLRDPRLLEETATVAAGIDEAELIAFLDRSGRAGVLLAANVSPELVLDDLALAWPHQRSLAA